MHCRNVGLVIPVLIALSATQAKASLTIIPTWDSSITSDPNAAIIEGTINSAISTYEADFSNPATVYITFKADQTIGLGQSNTYVSRLDYSTYISALTADKAGTNDTAFLSYLPTGPINPYSGNTDIVVSTADLKALNLSSSTGNDGTVSLKTSLMNLSRSGPLDPNKYDLQAVASHEINEVLGTSSYLGKNFFGEAASSGYDLFRYTANGVRATSADASNVYFSVDGGKSIVLDQYGNSVKFNAANNGGDLGDYTSSTQPRVQDAFGTPGTTPNLGNGELTALQGIGYNAVTSNVSAAPEPSSLSVLGLVGLALSSGLWRGRKRRLQKTAG